MASGPMAPLNVGMTAIRPNAKIFKLVLKYARWAPYSIYTGW